MTDFVKHEICTFCLDIKKYVCEENVLKEELCDHHSFSSEKEDRSANNIVSEGASHGHTDMTTLITYVPMKQ